MSFKFKYSSKNASNHKAQLQHKLYLARETPEPVFDISDCGLKSIPSGIYSLCKVFRKEALLVYNNTLNSLSSGGSLCDLSLLTVLDLHSNEFTKLPSDIKYLTSLKELYLQENNIEKLPNEITQLRCLTIINLSKNNLKELPESFGELKNIISLNISFNTNFKKLPKSLGYAQKIKQLDIDGLNLKYPPADIVVGGTIVIIAFLANESSIKYLPDIDDQNEIFNTDTKKLLNSESVKDNNIQAILKSVEKMKEQRKTILLDIEKTIKHQQNQELKLQNKLKLGKKELITRLSNQEILLEKEIQKLHFEKETNKLHLLNHLFKAEKETDKLIEEFLKNNDDRQNQTLLFKTEEQIKMNLLSNTHAQQSLHRTKDTLVAMEKLLEEELLKKKWFDEYTNSRNSTARSLHNIELKTNDQLLQVLQKQEKGREELKTKLRDDEVFQKSAVAALLERNDARSWSIVQQVNLVQSQLAILTNIEIERRKSRINDHLNDIAERRITLSAILINLLQQQEERHSQLLETMKQIECQRDLMDPTRKNSLFWLQKYQCLIESRPQGLLETLDPSLVRHVAIVGALHCLPFLCTLSSEIHEVNDDQLKSIGIKDENDVEAIKLAIENYLTEKKLNSNEYSEFPQPSAPIEEASSSTCINVSYNIAPSAPTECIICMDFYCQIIFLPCGHLCCCRECSKKIFQECPMCRTIIENRIKINSC